MFWIDFDPGKRCIAMSDTVRLVLIDVAWIGIMPHLHLPTLNNKNKSAAWSCRHRCCLHFSHSIRRLRRHMSRTLWNNCRRDSTGPHPYMHTWQTRLNNSTVKSFICYLMPGGDESRYGAQEVSLLYWKVWCLIHATFESPKPDKQNMLWKRLLEGLSLYRWRQKHVSRRDVRNKRLLFLSAVGRDVVSFMPHLHFRKTEKRSLSSWPFL